MGQDQENNINLEDSVQKDIEKLNKLNKKQQERIHKLQTKAFQVANLCFVFQGVILFSISSASSLKCRHWWIPFTLSLLASILNVFNFGSIFLAVLRAKEELDQNLADLEFMRLVKITRAQVNKVQPGASLPQFLARGSSIRPRPSNIRKLKRRGFAYLGIGLFLGFSVVVLYGCPAILCHSGK